VPVRIQAPNGYTFFVEHVCAEPGCWRTERLTPSVLPAFGEGEKDIVEDYCAEHAEPNGFCWGCGGLWAGVESFDFNNPSGLCENCREEDYDDDRNDEDDFYWGNEEPFL
jgi:hypothetical protein